MREIALMGRGIALLSTQGNDVSSLVDLYQENINTRRRELLLFFFF